MCGEILGPVGAVGAALLIVVREADISQPAIEQVAAVAVIGRRLIEEGVYHVFGGRVACGDILRRHGELVARGVDAIPRGLARWTIVVEIVMDRHVLAVRERGLFELRVLAQWRAVELAAVGVRPGEGAAGEARGSGSRRVRGSSRTRRSSCDAR